MTHLTNFIALLARIPLAILFVQGGYGKLFGGGMAGTVANMANHGIPFPNICAARSWSSSASDCA